MTTTGIIFFWKLFTLFQLILSTKSLRMKNISKIRLQDLKRDIQARLLNVETYGGETFLSEEVAINILQETKNAFQRCQLVTSNRHLITRSSRYLTT